MTARHLRRPTAARLARTPLPVQAWRRDDDGQWTIPITIKGVSDLSDRQVAVCYKNVKHTYLDVELLRIESNVAQKPRPT